MTGWPGPPGEHLSWAGRRVLVCGLGVSGRSAVAALTRLGADVVGYDESAGDTATPSLAGLDLVVTSPGWRPAHPVLAAAAGLGLPVWGEVELAWRLSPPGTRWLGVTGTNGKTTTTEMLAAVIAAAGARGGAAGNIGTPVVDAVLAEPPPELLAVELSSFQLHWAPSLRCAAAAVLNVADDHLDWHGGAGAYAAAKARIWADETFAVHNADDPWSARLVAARRPERGASFTAASPRDGQLGVERGALVDRAFGTGTLLDVGELQVAGPHNVANALAASALALAAGLPVDAVRTAVRHYRAGAHRNALVSTLDGVRYVDDSKATNPHAAAASLSAYPSVVWLAGGLNKGLTYDDLVLAHASRLRAAVLIGTSADELAEALARHAPGVPVARAGDMQTAVETARALARVGDVVLLAPAAASQDMFRDYAARGDAFTAAVHGLEAE